MQATELMIGDWVLFEGEPMQVWTIPSNEEITFEGTLEKYASDCTPILLTPEILEKNGFVANKHVYPYPYYEYINEEDDVMIGFAFPQGNRTVYKEPWVYIDIENTLIEHLPCIFLHQLQQILRLCGIEKEIIIP